MPCVEISARNNFSCTYNFYGNLKTGNKYILIKKSCFVLPRVLLRGGFLAVFLITAILSQGYDDVQNKFLLAQNYEQAGDFARAKIMYEEVYAKQPGNMLFIQSLNRVYIQLKEFNNSIILLERSLQSTPQDINMAGLLGKSYYSAGRETSADSLWYGFINRNLADASPYKVFSSYAIELRDFDLAIKLLISGKKATGNIKIFAFDLGYLYAITMQYQMAAEEYISLLKAAPEQYFAVQSRILSYIRKPEAMQITMDILKKSGYQGNAELTRLLAELHTESENFDEAFKLYINLDKQLNREGLEIHTFGSRIYHDKNFTVAAKVFSYLLETYPRAANLPQWKISYVSSLEGIVFHKTQADSLKWMPIAGLSRESAEEYRNIISMYNEIIALYPYSETAIDARIRTGYLYIFLGESKKGLEYFNKVTTDFPMYPGSAEAFRGKIEAHLRMGEIEEAYQVAKTAGIAGRRSEAELNIFRMELALLEFYKGNFGEAANILTEITKNSLDNKTNDALELSMVINGAMKDSVTLSLFAKAELETRRQKYDEAGELYGQIVNKSGAPFLLRNLSQFRIASILVNKGEYRAAADFIDTVLNKEKSVIADKMQFCQANIFEYGLKDLKRAYSVYEDFLSKFPKSIFIEEVRSKIVFLRNKSS